jgi:predicted transcriptional regulator
VYQLPFIEYIRRWGLPANYPKQCESFSRKRSMIGKRGAEIGRGAIRRKEPAQA